MTGVPTIAAAQYCTIFDDMAICSDGASTMRLSDTTFFDDGCTTTEQGDTTYFDDGSTTKDIGGLAFLKPTFPK